jgi:Ca2+-binding EF-hand superfamily protein
MSDKEFSKVRGGFEAEFKDGKVPMKTLESYLSEYLTKFNEKEILESLKRLDMDKDGKI